MKKKLRLIAVIMVSLVILSACFFMPGRKISGGQEGTLFSETKALDPYTKIDFEGSGKIVLVQGDSHSLKIDASPSVLEKIAVKQDGETLLVGFTDNVWQLSAITETVFTFTFVELSAFEMAGGTTIQAEELSSDSLDLHFEGGFKADLGLLDINALNVSIEGGGKISAKGQVDTQNVHVAGAGSYQMADLESNDVNIKIEGAGTAEIWAKNTLNLELEGAYSLDYWGDPQITQELSGVGTVKARGNK